LSGGGSALLTAPEDGITLNDKLEITRFLSGAGASINELNAVRKKLSKIKGGGMKALCRGKQLVSLILSDVIGDPLDVIASGPTVDNPVSAAETLTILQRFIADNFVADNFITDESAVNSNREASLSRIVKFLEDKAESETVAKQAEVKQAAEQITNVRTNRVFNINSPDVIYDSAGGFVQNIIIGNNAAAVAAAGDKGYALGYSPSMFVEQAAKKTAEETGVELAEIVLGLQNSIIQDTEPALPQTDLLIHGGEPVVHLVPAEIRGKGGRNQQLVLAALDTLLKHYGELNPNVNIVFLSGGTDGEDGPTDAAGAYFDSELLEKLHRQQTEMNDNIIEPFLKRNDAYSFFAKYNTLIKTGITGTNVCDVRIAAVSFREL
jgi:glycerate-2-kinase